MAASDKKNTIVIKKVTVVKVGGHSGSWKVALADFMTAMMAFFLVMWLVNQSEEVKKSVADYFSTPSIIEYNFSNYGVELTLEKLFLDLVNEPLKAFEQFIKPADKKPNLMDLGMKKIQKQYLAEKIGEYATDVQVTSDEITFEIPDEYLFKKNSADPAANFVEIMEHVREIAEGLRDTNVYVNSELPYRGALSETEARNVAELRLDIISNKIENSIDKTVDMFGKSTVEKISKVEGKRDARGFIKFRFRQKDNPNNRVLKTENNDKFIGKTDGSDVYDNFVNKLTKKAEGYDSSKKAK